MYIPGFICGMVFFFLMEVIAGIVWYIRNSKKDKK